MTLSLLIPLLAAVLGLLVYALSANPKASEAGRLLYFAGALVTLLVAAHGLR